MKKAPKRVVWLIEDNTDFRETVGRVVNETSTLVCPAMFGTCEDALEAMANAAELPEVILLDVGLPGMNGIQGIPGLLASAPKARIIILTVFDDDEKIFKAICAGATGYMLKLTPVDGIATAIHEVLAGGSPMNARIARRVLEMFAKLNPVPSDYGLSPREREVLLLMTQGKVNKEIATALHLSVYTVDSHNRNIYEKLQVHTRAGAVAKALKEQLI